MRILLIRHGDPDYANDTITEKGQREVDLLTARLIKENIDIIYCSPLGRAQDTASPTAKALGKEIQTLPFLKEIHMHYAMHDKEVSPWDIYPEIWSENPFLENKDKWMDFPLYDNEPLKSTIEKVHRETDALLLKHGYKHKGHIYEVLPGFEKSTETIALFCHMGLGNIVLSHLGGISTPLWWHSIFLPPTSVTTIYMERHRMDSNIAIAHFVGIGDISHLYAGNEPVSASGLKNCASPLFPPEPL